MEVAVSEGLIVVAELFEVIEAQGLVTQIVGIEREMLEMGLHRRIATPFKEFSKLYRFLLVKCHIIFENGSKNSRCALLGARIRKGHSL